MDEKTLLSFLHLAEKLKCNTRHSWTSSGRHESVAEHTYRLLVFAWLVRDEFPELDMGRVMELALFHDMGEVVTGDIPAFEKTGEDERTEEEALEQIASFLPGKRGEALRGIFREMAQKTTPEARLVNAMDKLEALIQHNEADIWLQYELQLTYGEKETRDIPYMERVNRDSLEKMRTEKLKEKSNFFVSADPSLLQLDRITALMRQSYWAKEQEIIKKAAQNSTAQMVPWLDMQELLQIMSGAGEHRTRWRR